MISKEWKVSFSLTSAYVKKVSKLSRCGTNFHGIFCVVIKEDGKERKLSAYVDREEKDRIMPFADIFFKISWDTTFVVSEV